MVDNNGNTLTINNNKAISFGGNSIKLPTDGRYSIHSPCK